MHKVDAECVRREIEARIAKQSQSALAREIGLGSGGQALLSKLLRGEPVSMATLRRIGRALHCLEQPRKLHRVVMKEDEFQAWQNMNRAERRHALGLR